TVCSGPGTEASSPSAPSPSRHRRSRSTNASATCSASGRHSSTYSCSSSPKGFSSTLTSGGGRALRHGAAHQPLDILGLEGLAQVLPGARGPAPNLVLG